MKLSPEKQISLIADGIRKAEELVEQYMPAGIFSDYERQAFKENAFEIVIKVASMEKDEALDYLKYEENNIEDVKKILEGSKDV